eukprot:TRINITY_DN3581_c0_g1_i1.p1 TRINITY_DN3581_c0_g1~~TRINITY_DN3581_c0_g1_i1.p1  ORF type:complete len:2533 (-),score=428.58 TRINITY_DN3581_c0_g1_i1:64-7662(-)
MGASVARFKRHHENYPSLQTRMMFVSIVIAALMISDSVLSDGMMNAWELITSYPPGFSTRNSVAFKGSVLLFPEGRYGDWGTEPRYMDHFYELREIDTFSWSLRQTLGSAPNVRDDYCLVATDEQIYLFGGLTEAFLGDLHILNMSTLSWSSMNSQVSASPRGRRMPYCFIYRDNLFVFGGMGPISIMRDLWRRSTIANTPWVKVDTVGESPQSYGGVYAVYADRLYIFGGASDAREMSFIDHLDLGLNTWTRTSITCSAGCVPSSIHRASAALFRNSLFVFFGALNMDSKAPHPAVFSIDLDLLEFGRHQQTMYDDETVSPYNNTFPLPRVGSSATTVGERIVLHGGVYNVIQESSWIFDPVDFQWKASSHSHFPMARDEAAITQYSSDSVLLFGGKLNYDDTTTFLNDLWLFQKSSENSPVFSWEQLSPLQSYGIETINENPPGLAQSSIGAYNGSVYVIGGLHDLLEVLDIAYCFRIDLRRWVRLEIADGANGIMSSFGQASVVDGSVMVLWGGVRIDGQLDSRRGSVTHLNLTSLEALSMPPNNYNLPARVASKGFLYGPGLFCVQGGYKYAASRQPGFDDAFADIQCFRRESNSWVDLTQGTFTRPDTRYGSFVYGGMGIYTSGVSKLGDPSSDIWFYNFGEKVWGKHEPASNQPPCFGTHLSALVDHYVGVFFAAVGDNIDHRVYGYNIGRAFCSNTVDLVTNGMAQSITDGSGVFSYMPFTNCTWKVAGANNILVSQMSLNSGASLDLHVDSSCAGNSIIIGSRTYYEKVTLTNLAHGTLVKVPSSQFRLSFSSSSSRDVLSGFTLLSLNCPSGFAIKSSRCVCQLNHYITPGGECRPCDPDSFQTQIDMHDCMVVGSRLTSTTNLISNATTGTWIFINESIPFCTPSLSASFLNKPYFFCLYPGEHPRDSEASPVEIFTINRISRVEWSYVKSVNSAPQSRKGACVVSAQEGIYYLGGHRPLGADSGIFLFNPLVGTWDLVGQNPFDLAGMICIVLGQEIYVHGGETSSGEVVNSMFVFNTVSRSWRSESWARSPHLSYHASWATSSGKIVLFGGYDGIQEMNTIYHGSNDTKSWSLQTRIAFGTCSVCLKHSETSCVSPRQMVAVAQQGGKVYIFGGYQRKVIFRDLLILDEESFELLDIVDNASRAVADQSAPPPMFSAAMTFANGLLYLHGGHGSQSGSPMNVFWGYDPETKSWIGSNQRLQPAPRRNFAWTKLGTFGFAIFGGVVTTFTEYESNDAWVFNRRLSRWVQVVPYRTGSTSPQPRRDCGIAYFALHLYVIGGATAFEESNLLWRIDLSRVVVEGALEVSLNWQAISVSLSTSLLGNPLLRSAFSWASLGSLVWIWGGEVNVELDAVEDFRALYVVDLRTWLVSAVSTSSDGPIPRTRHASIVLKDSYCIYGGQDFRQRVLNDIWCFQSNSTTWVRKDDPKKPGPYLRDFAVASYGPNLVMHGGINEYDETSNNIWMFQTDTSIWIRLQATQGLRQIYHLAGHAAFAFDDQMLLFGGSTQSIPSNFLLSFKPSLCPAILLNITSSATWQHVEDPSLNGKFPSGSACRWVFFRATHLILNYTVSRSERLEASIYRNNQVDPLLSISGSSATNHKIAATSASIYITYVSNAPMDSSDNGDGFRVSHIACPVGADLSAELECNCPDSTYHEKVMDACVSCDQNPKHPDCNSEPGAYLLSESTMAIILGLLGFVFAMVGGLSYRRYRTKIHLLQQRENLWLTKLSLAELEFGRLIGIGNFGEVYSGYWRGSVVAIKKVDTAKIETSSFPEFQDEVTTMIQLRHPNILLYMGVVIESPNLCIISEFMARGSLYDVLHDQNTTLDKIVRVGFLLDAAKGMQYLHMSKPPILHRDLKSSNLLLDEKWNLKISDFGLSGADHVGSHGKKGTLLWMAPEVILNQEYTRASDVYSFSIVMWEVFTRTEPYEGEVAESVVLKVVQDEYRPALPSTTVMDEALQRLMIHGWEQDSSRRPSFKDILSALNLIESDINPQPSPQQMSDKPPTSSDSGSSNAAFKSKVAIVLTDVHGSASLWSSIPQETSEALSIHNDLVRSCALSHQGQIVRTESDAFMLAFDSARSALLFCLSVQMALMEVKWPCAVLSHPACKTVESLGKPVFRGLRVRMGIHIGQSYSRQDPLTKRRDLYGPVVKVVSKMCKYTHGGQILVSEDVFREIEVDGGIQSVSVRDMGVYEAATGSDGLRFFEILPEPLELRKEHFDLLHSSCSSAPNFASASQSGKSHGKEKFSWQIEPGQISVEKHLLGTGSFGIVYKGEYLGQTVAIKYLIRQNPRDHQFFSLLAEINLIRCMDHPHILRFIGACLSPPNICMVTEFAHHGSLRDLLDDRTVPFGLDVRRHIIYQIADAMSYLHSRVPPICHRDLKSANVLVCSTNPLVAKIGDFGFAKIKSDTRTMTKCGTKGWLAPEVLKGLRYDEKADVYSFGILVWEVLTRDRPYAGVDGVRLNFDVVAGARPYVPKCNDRLVVSLMQRCWADDPAMRPSLDEVAKALAAEMASSAFDAVAP